MNDYKRFDELSRLIDAQRAICERLHDEWISACKALNGFEREQSALFRKMATELPPSQDRGAP